MKKQKTVILKIYQKKLKLYVKMDKKTIKFDDTEIENMLFIDIKTLFQ